MRQLRITGLYARRGLTAPRPPQWLGHSATLHSHAIAPAQFVGHGNATHFHGRQTVAYSRNVMRNILKFRQIIKH